MSVGLQEPILAQSYSTKLTAFQGRYKGGHRASALVRGLYLGYHFGYHLGYHWGNKDFTPQSTLTFFSSWVFLPALRWGSVALRVVPTV